MLVGKDASLPLTDLPRFAHEQLGLHGLMLSADLLAGRTRDDLTRLRDAADRARCACLVLMEEAPQKLAAADASAAAERIRRVMAASSLLGCNAASIAIDAPDTPEALETVAERFKVLMAEAEQRELNLLILPGPLPTAGSKGSLTGSPERLTELLKKIGGFRVGTMPDFAHAAQADDMPGYLRRVTPYASAVLGSTLGFKAVEGELDDERAYVEHSGFDLAAAIEAITAVGFDAAVGLDYQGDGDLRMGLRRSREGFSHAMAGNKGPFSLVQEEEFDDEMDAAAAALLDAIFSDSDDEDDEGDDADEDGPPARAKTKSASDDDEDFDDSDDDGDGDDASTARTVTKKKVAKKSANDDADESESDEAAKPAKKTSKKTTKKTSKKTSKKTEPEPDTDANDDPGDDGDES